MENATGIPAGQNATLTYFVVVSDTTLELLFSATVKHPDATLKTTNLPACDNLTVSVTAENLFFNGTSASEYFMTVEPGWYLSVITKMHKLNFTAEIEVGFKLCN